MKETAEQPIEMKTTDNYAQLRRELKRWLDRKEVERWLLARQLGVKMGRWAGGQVGG